MDEPLSNLDAKLRLEMRAEIRRIHQLLGCSTIYVTHDQEEALSLADRIVVLRDGQVRQVGTPEDLYARPPTPTSPSSWVIATSSRPQRRAAGNGVQVTHRRGAGRAAYRSRPWRARRSPRSAPTIWSPPPTARSPLGRGRRIPRPRLLSARPDAGRHRTVLPLRPRVATASMCAWVPRRSACWSTGVNGTVPA